MSNKVKTIKVILEDGQEFEYPAFERTWITHHMGYGSFNEGMLMQNRPNDKRLLVIISSTENDAVEELSKIIDDNAPKLINT